MRAAVMAKARPTSSFRTAEPCAVVSWARRPHDPQPDARILPTQDEFDAWCQHPCTQFVAEAYRLGAEKQRAAWERYFEASIVPADISAVRLELRTREDAYRSILENTLDDYLAIVGAPALPQTSRAPAPRGRHATGRSTASSTSARSAKRAWTSSQGLTSASQA